MEQVKLQGLDGGSLVIQANSRKWSTVTIEGTLKSTSVLVGSDALSVVRLRLMEFLQDPDAHQLRNAAGKLGDVPVSWIMSLSDPHGSLYATIEAGGTFRVLAQNAEMRITAELKLNTSQRVEWLRQLESFHR